MTGFLVRDPSTAQLPDATLVSKLSGVTSPRSTMRSWDDPSGVGFRRPVDRVDVQISDFTLRLDRGWRTNGHRFFTHESGPVILDRILPAETSLDPRLTATDRDTTIELIPGETETIVEIGTQAGTTHLDGTIGAALTVEPGNWGSFVARIIPKAIALRRAGCERLLVFCNHPRQREMLRLAGWSDDTIIAFSPARGYTADTWLLPAEPTNALYLHPTAADILGVLGDRFASPTTRDRTIFISRRGGLAQHSKRVCTNLDELEAAMIDLGLEVVIPDTMSVSEQIAMFADARLIVGPSGAGMFNTAFSAPGTAVIDIESQTDWLHGHNNLFSSIGVDFGMFLGRPHVDAEGPHKPYSVDISALRDRVAELL